VIEKIAVINFGMNDGGGNGRTCFGVEVRADASKLTNVVIVDLEAEEIWSKKVKCSSKSQSCEQLVAGVDLINGAPSVEMGVS